MQNGHGGLEGEVGGGERKFTCWTKHSDKYENRSPRIKLPEHRSTPEPILVLFIVQPRAPACNAQWASKLEDPTL